VLEASRTEIDGVPALWIDGGRQLLRATLRFRVGLIDETLATHGHLHLLEHLGMGHLDAPPYVAYNASVSSLFTSFDLEGPPAEVVRLLSAVCDKLGRIDEDEVVHEAQVLEQEARVRGSGVLDDALYYRWGAQGPGLVYFREFGLLRPDPEILRSLALRAFVRENAVLALDGPVPEGLSLSLASGGERLPIRLPPPARRLPGAGPSPRPLVSGLVRMNEAAVVGLAVLRTRVASLLMAEPGGTPWLATLESLGEHAHVALFAQSGDRAAAEAAVVLAELNRLADCDVHEAELADHLRMRAQAADRPDASANEPWLAMDRLLLNQPTSAAARSAELASVNAAALRAFGHQWRQSLLLTVPTRADAPAGLPWLTGSDERIEAGTEGRTHGVMPGVLDEKGAKIVRVGRVLQHQTTEAVTSFDLDRVALLASRPDGQRVLVGDDGASLVIEPTLWRDADELVRAAEDSVAPERCLELPARPDDEIPHPLNTWERVLVAMFGTRAKLWTFGILLILVAAALVGWALIAAGFSRMLGLLGVFIAGALIQLFNSSRKQT